MDTYTNSYALSEREFQIMQLVALGKLNKEIADMLKIKPDTIGKHLQHVYRKLKVQNRTQATVMILNSNGLFNLNLH